MSDDDGFEVEDEFENGNASASRKKHMLKTKAMLVIATSVRGFLVRNGIALARIRMRELSEEIPLYRDSAEVKLDEVDTQINKVINLKALLADEDFQMQLRKIKGLVKTYAKGLEDLQGLSKELKLHPGVGRDVALRYSQQWAVSMERCEKVGGQMMASSDELLAAARGTDVKRMLHALQELREIRRSDVMSDEMGFKIAHIQEVRHLTECFTCAKHDLCLCGDIMPHQLFAHDGEDLISGFRASNFFVMHPQVNSALRSVTAAVDAAAAANSAVLHFKERNLTWFNQVLMRKEELEQRAVEKTQRLQRQQENDHCLFVAMCRQWWESGIEQKEGDRAAARAAQRQEKDNKRLLRQNRIDTNETSPFTGARIGVSLKRMGVLLDEERNRQRFQEGREFDINASDRDTGDRLLHNACWAGHGYLVDFLTDKGCSVHQVSDSVSQLLPLHIAARAGQADIVRLLLQAGADLSRRDASGDTALHWAARRDQFTVVRVLLQQLYRHKGRTLRGMTSAEKPPPSQAKATRFYAFLTHRNHRGKQAKGLTSSLRTRKMVNATQEELERIFPQLNPAAAKQNKLKRAVQHQQRKLVANRKVQERRDKLNHSGSAAGPGGHKGEWTDVMKSVFMSRNSNNRPPSMRSRAGSPFSMSNDM